VQRALSLVAQLGYRLPPDDDGRLVMDRGRPPAGLPQRYVVLAPGASVPARAWAPRHYRALAELLDAESRHVVVTGTDAQRDLTGFVAGTSTTCLDLGGATTFAELAAVVANADVVVTGNSGTAHVAAATGTPVVSLYAPTVPARQWRPWRVPHVLLGDQSIECAGCRSRHCPIPAHPCIDEVRPIEALRALEQLRTPATPAPTRRPVSRPAMPERAPAGAIPA
jgi:ADP-heptose:LPS heptosyltransferase